MSPYTGACVVETVWSIHLMQIPDTYLTGLFNGRWESKIHRDKEGRVFLDFIPSVFRLLLDYLTTLRLAKSPKDISPPTVGDKFTQDFRMLLQHLGLEEAIYGSPKCFSQMLKSSSIVLRSDNMCAMSDADGMGFVLGKLFVHMHSKHISSCCTGFPEKCLPLSSCTKLSFGQRVCV